jgi:hypothetical protein
MGLNLLLITVGYLIVELPIQFSLAKLEPEKRKTKSDTCLNRTENQTQVVFQVISEHFIGLVTAFHRSGN